MGTEEEITRGERQVRDALSRVFAFVRSSEIGRKFSSDKVTIEALIGEQIILLDDRQVAEEADVTSVDSTGRSLFIVEGEWATAVKRRGKLQRLAALAADVLSEDDFDEVFGEDGLSFPDLRTVDDDSSLFQLLRDHSYEVSGSVDTDTNPAFSGEVVSVTYRWTTQAGSPSEYETLVPVELLTPEQRNSPGGLVIELGDVNLP